MNRLCVILANFNDSRYLINWVNHFKDQMPDELIIVDDCSTDNSMQLLRWLNLKYPKIKIIQTKKNTGCPFAAVMEGIKITTCDYISAWSCDDDAFSGYTAQMIKAINDYPFVDVVTCNSFILREGEFYERTALPYDTYISPQYMRQIAKTNGISAINVIGSVIRRKLIIDCWEAGGKYLKTYFDAFYLYIGMFKTGMILLSDPLVLYRANFKGFGSSKSIKDNVVSIEKMNLMLKGFPEAEEIKRLWAKPRAIFSTIFLHLLPRLPKFIRRMIYRRFYSLTF